MTTPETNSGPRIETIVPFRGRTGSGAAQFPSRSRTGSSAPERVIGNGTSAALPARLGFSADLLHLTLVLLVAFAVSRVHEQYSILVALRQAVLLGLLIGLAAFGNARQLAPQIMLSTWPARVIAGLAIMACISVPFGLSMGASGRFLLQGYSKVLLLTFLIIVGIRGTRDLYTMLTGFLIGSGILVLLALFVLRIRAMGTLGVLRIAGGGSGYSFDGNDLSVTAAVGLGIAILLALGGPRRIRIMAALIALGLVVTIARTGSRGGFLGLVAVAVGFLFLAGTIRFWKKLLLLGVAGGSLFLVAPSRYWEQIRTIFTPTQDYNYTDPTGRVAVWKRGVTYMLEHPLTGVGVSNFGRAEGTISPAALAHLPGQPGVKWMAPHNSFIEAGSEMGLPGLALFSALVLGGIIGMVRLQRRVPRGWKNGSDSERLLFHAPTGLAIAMLGFAVAGSFVSFAYLDLVYILGALMAGTYLCIRQALGTGPQTSRFSSLARRSLSAR